MVGESASELFEHRHIPHLSTEPQAGFEPATFALQERRSGLLSYKGVVRPDGFEPPTSGNSNRRLYRSLGYERSLFR